MKKNLTIFLFVILASTLSASALTKTQTKGRANPFKKVVVKKKVTVKKTSSIVHTKILDNNLIDPTKPPFSTYTKS